MTKIIKVSIIIPHYNRVAFLKQTLQSIMFQSYQDWEVIIVDDYSGLDCINIVKKFIANESRIILFTKTNQTKGASASRNIGLDIASGQYVFFLDSDDILAPFALEQRLEPFLKSNFKLHAVLAPTLLFNNFPGDKQEAWSIFDNRINLLNEFLNGHSYFNTMSAIWLKSFIVEIGGWNENLSSYQDWEFHIRALLKGFLYKEIPEYDNFYRTHSDEQSIAGRFFNDDIAIGRFNAFKTVFSLLNNSSRKDLLKPYRGFVIRHLVQLIDHQKNDLVKNLLDNRVAFGLKWYDVKILIMMMSDGYAWRYRKTTKYLTKFFWHDLEFDPWLNTLSNKSLEINNIKALSYDYQQLLIDNQNHD